MFLANFGGKIAYLLIEAVTGHAVPEKIQTGFPSFGIWSVPGSPFVCLEPWMGRCDDFGFKGELPEKKYINTLDKDEIFTASYEIKIY